MQKLQIGKSCTLKIKNFLSLKQVDCEMKGVNVFIGPQAEGKSLIAKLTFFFQEFLFETIRSMLESDNNIQTILEKGISRFTSYFPGDAWADQNFSIEYSHGAYSLAIVNEQSLEFKVSQNLIDELSHVINAIDIERSAHLSQFDVTTDEQVSLKKFDASEFIPDTLRKSILFVPAQRNMLSALQANMFTTMKEKGNIDSLLVSYGSKFESMNNFIYFTERFRDTPGGEHLVKARNRFLDSINEELGKFFKGEYAVLDRETVIKAEHGDVKLQHASSGQQEVAPLAPILTGNYQSIFVEEPEAHLYPSSQKGVVELFAKSFNEDSERGFTLTTHSPYVLATLNNLIAAHNATLSNDKMFDLVADIIPKEHWLPFEAVSAWYVNNGTAKSIMNNENRLIDANAIDDVSDQLADEFEALLDIQYGDGDDC